VKRILWSDIAKQDFRSALAWLRRQNRRAAMNAELDILNMIVSISQRPSAGRSDNATDVKLRSLPKWHRRIAYRIEGDDIRILSIRDARQRG
jgi:plasmid stabilization system protein ParE